MLFYVSVRLVFLTTDCTDTATTGVPEIEHGALEALWDSSNCRGWTSKIAWDTNDPIMDWDHNQLDAFLPSFIAFLLSLAGGIFSLIYMYKIMRLSLKVPALIAGCVFFCTFKNTAELFKF